MAPRSRHCQVAPDWRYPQSRTEHEMRPSGEALGEAVSQHPCDRERREIQTKPIQRRDAEHKYGDRNDDRDPRFTHREHTAGNLTHLRAWILRVDVPIDD